MSVGSMRPPPVPASRASLKMSFYEQVASSLIAMLILVGTVVGVLFVMWLAPRLRYQVKAYRFTLEEEGYGRGDHPAGFGRDSKAPGDPSLPMLDEPAGEEMPGLEEPEFADTVANIGDVVTAVVEVGDIAYEPTGGTAFLGFGGKGGGEGGLGDSRPPGPLGDNPDVIFRGERWEIRYTSASLESYARQLDFFKIELAAVGRKPHVDYAFNLAKPKPDTRTGPSSAEKRLYLSWRSGPLQEFDRQLLTRAGIETQGRIIVQFYSQELEGTLATLEANNAPGRSNREFYRTVFGVRPNRGELEFFVLDQLFRPAAR